VPTSDLVIIMMGVDKKSPFEVSKKIKELKKKMPVLLLLNNNSDTKYLSKHEDDLKYALQNNIIAGAAIDAYIEEPPKDIELVRLPNLICTPHIGGNAKEAVEAMGVSAISHLKEFLRRKSEFS